jgi:hypothetical protein
MTANINKTAMSLPSEGVKCAPKATVPFSVPEQIGLGVALTGAGFEALFTVCALTHVLPFVTLLGPLVLALVGFAYLIQQKPQAENKSLEQELKPLVRQNAQPQVEKSEVVTQEKPLVEIRVLTSKNDKSLKTSIALALAALILKVKDAKDADDKRRIIESLKAEVASGNFSPEKLEDIFSKIQAATTYEQLDELAVSICDVGYQGWPLNLLSPQL